MDRFSKYKLPNNSNFTVFGVLKDTHFWDDATVRPLVGGVWSKVFSPLCLLLKEIIKIVRLLLSAVGIKGLKTYFFAGL